MPVVPVQLLVVFEKEKQSANRRHSAPSESLCSAPAMFRLHPSHPHGSRSSSIYVEFLCDGSFIQVPACADLLQYEGA